MRIAPKPVTNNPSAAETSSTSKSSGGSFLDILIQGTQDAVQPAKGYGSQTQSDARSSSQNSSDDSQSKDPSSQTISSASTTDVPPQPPSTQTPSTQTTTANNSQQSGATATGTTQGTAGTGRNNSTQSLSDLLALMDLATASNNAAAASPAAQQTTTTTVDQVLPSGKQTGTTKTVQGKQDAAKGADSGTSSQQLAAALTVPVAVADPLPQIVVAATTTSSTGYRATGATDVSQHVSTTTTATNAGLQIASTAALAGEVAAQTPTDQAQPAASSQESGQGQQQGGSTASIQAATPQLKRDLFAGAATLAKSSSDIGLTVATNSASQVNSQKPAAPFDPIAGSALAAAALQQNDAVPNQSTAKAVPLKSATNAGPNSNASATAPASSDGTGAGVSMSATTASKSGSQDASNSSRDNQGNTNANTQAAAVVRTADGGVSQSAALGTFAAAHAAAQTTSTSVASDEAPARTSASRNVPSEAANAALAAGSSAINSARVIQSMNETEMRVGMRSTEFGDISIRTMVTQQQMQTQISVDHSELVSALTAHIPAVQAKLGADYGLHASIEVSQGGASFAGNQEQSSQREYKPSTPFTQMDLSASSTETDRVTTRSVVAAAAIAEGSRLDIRA